MDFRPRSAWIQHLDRHASRYFAGLAVLFAVFGAATVSFYPSYSWPHGDEGTYLDYARHPWTLTSEFFEGYRPKVVQNPYNARLFLNPFSVVFAVFGFTYVGARMVCVAYGVAMLWLVFRLTNRIAAPHPSARAAALLATLVFALQPQLLYFTHGIRPEILFSLGLLLNTWLLVRRERPTTRTWLTLGLTSSCMLFVHYNGVTAPVLFFLAALWHDRGHLAWRKVLAFVGGGLIFLAVFLPVNFLPALDTVREFGLLPVTFVSSNEIPLTRSADLFAPIRSAALSYMGFWTGVFESEPRTMWFSTALLLPAFLGLRRGTDRTIWTLLATFGLLLLVLVFLIPNRRWEYGFYLCPWFFVFTGGCLTHPQSWRRGLAILALLAAAGGYVWSDAKELTTFAGYREGNLATEAALQRAVQELGGENVTVMATQEFRAAVPEVRYRTFHSTLATRSFERSLDLLQPRILVIHSRTLQWLASRSQSFRIPQGLGRRQRLNYVANAVTRILTQRGFTKATATPLSWDGGPVILFVRR